MSERECEASTRASTLAAQLNHMAYRNHVGWFVSEPAIGTQVIDMSYGGPYLTLDEATEIVRKAGVMSLEVVSTTPIEPCECGYSGVRFATLMFGKVSLFCAGCQRSDGRHYTSKADAITAWNERRNKAKAAANEPTRPSHYELAPGSPQPIDIAEHLSFCLGNVVKYVARAGRKDDALTDLRKARVYLDREISRLEANS